VGDGRRHATPRLHERYSEVRAHRRLGRRVPTGRTAAAGSSPQPTRKVKTAGW
jgi:hypothetical protein